MTAENDHLTQLSHLRKRRNREAILELLLDEELDHSGTAYQITLAMRGIMASHPLDWNLEHHKNGQPAKKQPTPKAIEEPHEEPASSSHLASDPWDQARWREEILRYALANNGIFDVEKYAKEVYDHTQHGGHTRGTSRMGPALYDTFNRAKLLKKIKTGVYKLNARGRKAAQTGNVPAERAPGQTQRGRKRDQQDDFVTSLVEFGQKHGGVIDVPAFRKAYAQKHGHAPSNGPLYIWLRKPEGYFREIDIHHFALTGKPIPLRSEREATTKRSAVKAGRKPGPQYEAATFTDDILEYAAAQENGEFTYQDYRSHYQQTHGKFPPNIALGSALRHYELEDQLERIGKSRYKLVRQQQQARTAHA